MSRIGISLAWVALISSQSQGAEVFKCKTADGRTTFSSGGCGTEAGEFERSDLKINRTGSLATESEISKMHQDRAAAGIKARKITVIRDTSRDDSRSVQNNIDRRQRAREDALEKVRRPDPSGVNVIKSYSGESQSEKSMRLRTEAIEAGY